MNLLLFRKRHLYHLILSASSNTLLGKAEDLVSEIKVNFAHNKYS